MITVIQSAVLSLILTFSLSFFVHDIWKFYILFLSIAIIIFLLLYKRYYGNIARRLIAKHPDLFFSGEEEMLTAAAGIFIPQVQFIINGTKIEFAAASGWVQVISIIGIIIAIFTGEWLVMACLVVVLVYSIFSKSALFFYCGEKRRDIERVIILTMGTSKAEQLGLTQGKINSLDSASEFADYSERYHCILEKLIGFNKKKYSGGLTTSALFPDEVWGDIIKQLHETRPLLANLLKVGKIKPRKIVKDILVLTGDKKYFERLKKHDYLISLSVIIEETTGEKFKIVYL
ncbi:MAG: hypothetical protein WC451_02365 [Patescibacteria group bacterium]